MRRSTKTTSRTTHTNTNNTKHHCSVPSLVGNYVVAQFTPILLQDIGFGMFFVFGVFSIVGFFLASWLPETKGVLLEHIDQLFDEKFGIQAKRVLKEEEEEDAEQEEMEIHMTETADGDGVECEGEPEDLCEGDESESNGVQAMRCACNG